MASPIIQQQLLADMGYTGDMNNAYSWLSEDPNRQKMLNERMAARDQGYMGQFGGGAYMNWVNQGMPNQMQTIGGNQYDQGGIVPVGRLEPFNDYQKQGINQLAEAYNPSLFTTGENAINNAVNNLPNITNLFNQGSNLANNAMYTFNDASATAAQANPAIQQGMREFTDQDFNQGMSRYLNPYQQEVIDRSLSRLNEQADAARSRIKGSMAAGGSSFGSTAQGVESGLVSNELLSKSGDLIAQLNAQNYDQAANRSRDDFSQARNRNLQGAGLFNQTAGAQTGIGSAQGALSNQMMGQGFQGISSLLNAGQLGMSGGQAQNSQRQTNISNLLAGGDRIQNQNQRMLDIIEQERQKAAGYDTSQLTSLAQLLNAFPGSSSSYGGSAGGNTTLGNLGGLGLSAVGIGNNMGWFS